MAGLTRRLFLIAGGVATAGIAVGVGYLASIDTENLNATIENDGTVRLNIWIHVRPDGKIVLAIPRTEMGQGVFTALPMLIAEELEIDIDDPNLIVEHPTELLPAYTNFTVATFKRPEERGGPLDWTMERVAALFPYIGTGGSTSVVDGYQTLRIAGATARELLIAAATERWGVQATSLKAERGFVINPANNERLQYAALARDAARQAPPEVPVLKSSANWKLIGTAVPRLDVPAKVNGTAAFGADMIFEDMLYAFVVNAPVFGDSVAAFNESEILAAPRVVSVVNLDTAIAVVAETYYHAKKAATLLDVTYVDGGNRSLSSADISARLREAFDGDDRYVARDNGDVERLLIGDNVIELEYETPYLAHACMEPMNCTALYREGHAELWAPVQTPLALQWAAEKNVDDLRSVVGHVMYNGGGFGRRAEMDYTFQAMRVAKANPGRPVKLLWSREEDIQHDMYRPAAVARFRAKLDEHRQLVALDSQLALQSVNLGFSRRNLPFPQGGAEDPLNVEGLAETPYRIPNFRVTAANAELPVPIGNWRSVGHSNNAFFMESLIDELAVAAKTDRFEFRRVLLAHDDRALELIDRLAEQSGWSGPGGSGVGRGVAVHASFRSLVGQVVDVTVSDGGDVKVNKVTCVIDCGTVIHPDIVRQQMESGIIFALSAAAFGEVTIEGGRVQQSNFHNYDMVRMAQSPEIEVYIMDNNHLPGGVGEPGTPPLFAGLCNAIFAATLERIRTLPITTNGFRLA